MTTRTCRTSRQPSPVIAGVACVPTAYDDVLADLSVEEARTLLAITQRAVPAPDREQRYIGALERFSFIGI